MISAKQLVERLENKQETKNIYFDNYLNDEIEIKKMSLPLMMSYVGDVTQMENNLPRQYDKLCEIIFKSVPVFQDEELLSAYNIKQNKYSVVTKIYDSNFKAINEIFNYILELYGLGDEKKLLNTMKE